MRLALLSPCLLLVSALASRPASQTNLRAWNRAGQTWLVWEDDQTFANNEHYAIYRSPAPIADTADPAVVLAGRLYPQDWRASRLKFADPSATWTVPDAAGAPYGLLPNEAVFGYTPHAAAPEYFAVVKSGNTALGPGNAVGPVAQALDPIVPHVQLTGVDAGHSYTVWALWIDGSADLDAALPGFPILANQHQAGTAALFAVFEPIGGAPPAQSPAVIFLHGGGGSFWTFRPSQSASHQLQLDVPDGWYVTVDDNMFLYLVGPLSSGVASLGTRWFGYCDSFDRFEPGTIPPPAGSSVTDYTLRKLDWIVDWVVSELDADAARIAMMGLSNGARGVMNYVRSRPEAISAGTCFVLPVEPEAGDQPAMWGEPSDNIPTNLPGAPGITDYLYPSTTVSTLDLPFLRIIHGTNDTKVPWDDIPTLEEAIDALRWGAALYWDERTHTHNPTGGWAGAHFVGSPRHSAQWITRYRNDLSYPALHGVDHNLAVIDQQPHPGDPVVPANGDPWGTWGGWFDWDDASNIDTPDRWSIELGLVTVSPFANDVPPAGQARASVTLRRAQTFGPPVHEPLQWRLTNAVTGAPIANGSVQVDAAGLVTVPDLPFGTVPVVLEVQRAARATWPFVYGAGTAGCTGVPTIGHTLAPQVGTAGFDFTSTNAQPSTFGVLLLGTTANEIPILGIELLVSVGGGSLLFPAHADGVGSEVLPLGIPNDPALVGQVFYAQFAWLDACGPAGFSASPGLAVPILP